MSNRLWYDGEDGIDLERVVRVRWYVQSDDDDDSHNMTKEELAERVLQAPEDREPLYLEVFTDVRDGDGNSTVDLRECQAEDFLRAWFDYRSHRVPL